MYNPEVKSAFINSYTDSIVRRDIIIALFNQTQPYEESAGTDLCAMSVDMLQPIITEIMTVASDSSRVKRTTLREYFKWCRDKNIPGACDSFSQIDSSNTNAIKTRMVGNPLQLQRYLNEAYMPESDHGIDNIFRCVFWLSYGGIRREDITLITTDEVNIDQMLIEHDGISYPIYREGIGALRNCKELSGFVYRGIENGRKSRYLDRLPGNKLVRSVKGNQNPSFVPHVFVMAAAAVKKKGNIDIRLNYYSTWLSGFFYRLYEQEILTGSVDFQGAARELLATKKYNYSGEKKRSEGFTERVRFSARQYRTDYEKWKDVFIK